MGAARSRLVRTVKKPVESWGRAEKILEKKPVAAPRHPTTKATLDEMENVNREKFQDRDSKDDRYLGLLKDLKVESVDVTLTKESTNVASQRKLPQARQNISAATTSGVPDGRISQQQIGEIFARHMKDPETWTAQKISESYKLDHETVKVLLRYYSGYAVIQQRELPRPFDKVNLID